MHNLILSRVFSKSCSVKCKMLEKLNLEETIEKGVSDDIPDSDSVSQDEVDKEFTQKYYIQTEEAVSLQKSYVLHLDKVGNSLVAGMSGPQVHVFDISGSSLTKVHTCRCYINLF